MRPSRRGPSEGRDISDYLHPCEFVERRCAALRSADSARVDRCCRR